MDALSFLGQFVFLENCPPTPPLSRHFALSPVFFQKVDVLGFLLGIPPPAVSRDH